MNTNMNSFFYSTELTYYSTAFLCEVIVNRSGFNVISTNISDAHVYEHMYSPKDGSKNQLDDYLSTPLMPEHLSIAHASIINFYSARLRNKHTIVHEGTGYPSNWLHTNMTFPLQVH